MYQIDVNAARSSDQTDKLVVDLAVIWPQENSLWWADPMENESSFYKKKKN